MNGIYIKLIETTVVVTLYIILRVIYNRLVDRTMREKLIQSSRAAIIKKGINLIALVVVVLFLSTVWGVQQSDLVVFLGSILTVVGVAMFAQWSTLSNITASVIIFFNHSVKIDDTIRIMEGKDYEIEGKVVNIGLFFVTLITVHNEQISLPNNIFMSKMIKNNFDPHQRVDELDSQTIQKEETTL